MIAGMRNGRPRVETAVVELEVVLPEVTLQARSKFSTLPGTGNV